MTEQEALTPGQPSKKVRTVRLSIRDFAVPVPRVGHIETNSGYDKSRDVGSEIHEVIQAARKRSSETYRSEVFLKDSFSTGAFKVIVSGRADGVFDDEVPLVEEIKTAFNLDRLHRKLLEDTNHPYVLQAKTYAYFLYRARGVVPKCRICVVSQRNFTQQFIDLPFSVEEYELWLELRLRELDDELRYLFAQRKRRNDLSKALAFPFPTMRSGQKDLIELIQSNCGGGQVMVQAPTGLGKTAGVLYPVLKHSLSNKVQTFYLTPKNSQHELAEGAVAKFNELGFKVKALTMTAKTKACLKAEPLCQPDYCEFAKDYYTKLAKHRVIKKLLHKGQMRRDVIESVAIRYEVCPYQLARDTAVYADLVIGDYHYGFAPLGRLDVTGTMIDEKSKPNLVIDEAHNLFGRVNDYYSGELSESVLASFHGRLQELPEKWEKKAAPILIDMQQVFARHAPKNGIDQAKANIDSTTFGSISKHLGELVVNYLESDVDIEARDPLLDLQRYWDSFCHVLDYEGEQFFNLYVTSRQDRQLRISCCDASVAISQCLQDFDTVVAFSATLKPFDYYAKLCGFQQDQMVAAEFASPFPQSNRKVLIIPQVSTTFKDRANNYDKIADAIYRLVSVRKGNYLVFFPSFPFLRDVMRRLPNHPHGGEILAQEPQMSAHQVSKLLAKLKEGKDAHLVFAVQGGVLSEGVDYPGETLIGAIIVGPGLPQHDLERTLHREYYEQRFGNGFDYAYTFPAMAKVIQAAGRVIRSETDRGVIVLMDRRFLNPTYSSVLPRYWYKEDLNELVSNSILKDLETFWSTEP